MGVGVDVMLRCVLWSGAGRVTRQREEGRAEGVAVDGGGSGERDEGTPRDASGGGVLWVILEGMMLWLVVVVLMMMVLRMAVTMKMIMERVRKMRGSKGGGE